MNTYIGRGKKKRGEPREHGDGHRPEGMSKADWKALVRLPKCYYYYYYYYYHCHYHLYYHHYYY